MTQYNTLNVKLSNLQLNQFKLGMKNGTKVLLNLLSNVISDSNDETNFLHKLSLSGRPASRFCKAFANNTSANIKFQVLTNHCTCVCAYLKIGGRTKIFYK